MRHGHGTTNDSPEEQQRRREGAAREQERNESNRQRAIGGGKPNELGVLQGQNGEQGQTVKPETAYDRGKVRH